MQLLGPLHRPVSLAEEQVKGAKKWKGFASPPQDYKIF
jgi:hypothetical protein